MIDVCFSDTIGGMLSVAAKNINSSGVFPLRLNLCYGCLDGNIIESQIKRNADTLRYYYRHITEEEIEEEYEDMLKSELALIEELEKFLKKGHEVRLWINRTATDRCGLSWFCNFA